MLFSNEERVVYDRSPLHEVICQIRFPDILAIEAKEPADFQEAIRADFPRYLLKKDQPAPKITGFVDGIPQVDRPAPITNYHFVSADNMWKLNLTRNFIALSTLRYTCWEDFAKMLDKPLAQFIKIYQPAFFQRIGLRYVNGISREKLELGGRRWNDLIQSRYLGVLDDDDVEEGLVSKCSVDVERKLADNCAVKLHAGPGMIQRAIRTPQGIKQLQEKDVRFIFDMDVYSAGNLPLQDAARVLESVHSHCDNLFSEAITDVLHNAMEPVVVD